MIIIQKVNKGFTTGPIMYTKTIYPIRNKYKNTFKHDNYDKNLVYSLLNSDIEHVFYINHYSLNENYIIDTIKSKKIKFSSLVKKLNEL